MFGGSVDLKVGRSPTVLTLGANLGALEYKGEVAPLTRAGQ